ncbi:hypothetical protein MED16_gp70 [Pantoea phage vB_PagS_MED16]|nr:hypothetical protein MED16_gp70 [Pantoea phage vB_PagS_MED16]
MVTGFLQLVDYFPIIHFYNLRIMTFRGHNRRTITAGVNHGNTRFSHQR